MVRQLVTTFVVIIGPAVSAGAVAQEESIVEHEFRTAFYEIAPKAMADSMRRAAATVCADKGTVEGWLCDGRPLVFLSAVLVTGAKRASGYICPKSDDRLKFYTLDMVREDCAPVDYDPQSGESIISILDL